MWHLGRLHMLTGLLFQAMGTPVPAFNNKRLFGARQGTPVSANKTPKLRGMQPMIFISYAKLMSWLLPGLAGVLQKTGVSGVLTPGLSNRASIPRLHMNLKPPPPARPALPKEKVKKKKGDESYSDEEKVSDELMTSVSRVCAHPLFGFFVL